MFGGIPSQLVANTVEKLAQVKVSEEIVITMCLKLSLLATVGNSGWFFNEIVHTIPL